MNTEVVEDNKVEVTVIYLTADKAPPEDGPGWYAYETEYPEEGFFWVGAEKPTLEQLQAICPEYVEEKD